MKAVVPSRITAALDLRRLEGPGVDAALGVPEPTVDRWESGELAPTRAQLLRLALLTGFPVAYFTQPGRPRAALALHVCADIGGEGS